MVSKKRKRSVFWPSGEPARKKMKVEVPKRNT